MPTRAFIAILLLCVAADAGARDDRRVESVLGNDVFLAGGSVMRSEPVAGDLIAAGGQVDVDGPVEGDALVAGGSVRLGSRVAQSVYAAGGRLAIQGEVGRNVRAAGGHVDIGPNASIKGNVTAAGGEVRVRGPVQGYVQVTGGRIYIDAAVTGDVVANGGSVELGPNARIAGNMRYRGRDEVQQDAHAQVAGGIEHLASLGRDAGIAGTRHNPLFGGWIWSTGLIVLAAIVAGALPAQSARIAGHLRTHPGLSIIFGFIAFVCVPMAIALLMVTVIGIPLALLVLLVYLALLLVGYATAAVGIGDAVLARARPADLAHTGWRVAAAVLAMLALTLLARIPFVGGVVAFVAILFGMGAVLVSIKPPGKATPATAPVPPDAAPV